MANEKKDADNGAKKPAGGKGNDPKPKADEKTDDQSGGGLPKTQAEIDQIVQDRIKRERAKWETEQKENAEKSELEIAQANLEKEKANNRLLSAQNKFLAESGLPAAKAARAFRIIQSDLTFDKDGNPENLTKLIEENRKELPELFAATDQTDIGQKKSGDDGAAGDKAGNGAMNSILRRSAGRGD